MLESVLGLIYMNRAKTRTSLDSLDFISYGTPQKRNALIVKLTKFLMLHRIVVESCWLFIVKLPGCRLDGLLLRAATFLLLLLHSSISYIPQLVLNSCKKFLFSMKNIDN